MSSHGSSDAENSRGKAAPNLGLCLDDHVDLDDMGVRQFTLHPAAQCILFEMQSNLLERPYAAFGRTLDSPEQFNIVLPRTFGSDRRKPVTPEFQAYCEEIFWPLFNALFFGTIDWQLVAPHLTSFKINTLRISESEFYYNEPIYHFHLDHKIGRFAPKDENQIRTMRMIFSIVPGSTREVPSAASKEDGRPETRQFEQVADSRYDSTVYLRRQPPHGFHHNDELHQYLQTRFPERGLSRDRERPLYEVGDPELYRAKPGEVLTHHSHPGR